MNNRTKPIVSLLILLIIIIPCTQFLACGGKETPPATPATPSTPATSSATGNQPPVISSLRPAQTQVYPSSASEIQVIASDPDGDRLTYKWAATGGSFSASQNSSFIIFTAFFAVNLFVLLKFEMLNISYFNLKMNVVIPSSKWTQISPHNRPRIGQTNASRNSCLFLWPPAHR